MALKFIEKQIVGTIDSLEEKLNGELPINRLELLYLVNSWGRNISGSIRIKDNENNEVNFSISEPKECYDLSKLDTSEITDMSNLFKHSQFNGDISNWNTSDVTTMSGMFHFTTNFNKDINSWDVSKVTNMSFMFTFAKAFNQDINNWNVSNVTDMHSIFAFAPSFNKPLLLDLSNINDTVFMFYEAQAFQTKFNNGNPLPEKTNDLKQWLKENRDSDKMLAIDIIEREKDNLDSFFNNLNNINNDIDSRECNLIK